MGFFPVTSEHRPTLSFLAREAALNFLPSAGSQRAFSMWVPHREDLGLYEPLCSCLAYANNQGGPQTEGLAQSWGSQLHYRGDSPIKPRVTKHSHMPPQATSAGPKGNLAVKCSAIQ